MLNGVTKAVKNKTRKQRGFPGALVGTIGSNLLGYLLSGKGIVRVGSVNKKRKRNSKSWFWKRMGFLMLPHLLTNYEIQKYYQNEKSLMVFFLEKACLKK